MPIRNLTRSVSTRVNTGWKELPSVHWQLTRRTSSGKRGQVELFVVCGHAGKWRLLTVDQVKTFLWVGRNKFGLTDADVWEESFGNPHDRTASIGRKNACTVHRDWLLTRLLVCLCFGELSRAWWLWSIGLVAVPLASNLCFITELNISQITTRRRQYNELYG